MREIRHRQGELGGIKKLVRLLPDPNRHLDLIFFGRESILLASFLAS